MHVSARIEYACLAAIELAQHDAAARPARVRDIAQSQQIPSGFLVQVLLQMKAAGIVRSVRGAGGGYRLARTPSEISLADLIDSVSGDRESTPRRSEATESATRSILSQVWEELHDIERKYLESVSLAELAARRGAATETMYYI